VTAPNPDNDPATALAETKSLDLERELVDRYQAFSAEILRLSLLGLAVIGFFLERLRATLSDFPQMLLGLAALLFGLAAAFALYHRYWSVETLRLFVWSLRFDAAGEAEKARQCLTERNERSRNCIAAKVVSCALLGMGAVSLAAAFVWPLWLG
jgi:hypothetical protein